MKMRCQNMTAISAARAAFLAASFACGVSDASYTPPPEYARRRNDASTTENSRPFSDFGSATGGDAVRTFFHGESHPFSDFGGTTEGDAVNTFFHGGSHPFRDFGVQSGGDRLKEMLDEFNPYTKFGKDSSPNMPSDHRTSPAGITAGAPATSASAGIAFSTGTAPDEDEVSTHDAPIPWADAEKVGQEDAAANFSNVVRTYLAKHGSDGHWAYASGAKTRVLDFIEVDTEHVREAGSFYAACATFREVGSRRRIRLEFTADFNDAEWKVVSVKPRSRAGPCLD